MEYILSIDLGTTGNRVIVFDKNAKVISKFYKELNQIYPQTSYVEHDANEILDTVKDLLNKTFKVINPEFISGIGITNQRETIVCFDKKTGVPLYNAIVWQDSRTESFCEELRKDKGFNEYIEKNTGLKINPYFSATKIKWLLDNVVNGRDVLFGTIDSWIIYKLTGVFVTDHTNASRTMLYNLNSNEWDSKLLDKFGVKKSMLPKIVNSSEIVSYFEVKDIKIPIAGIAGDQQAALFGQRCFNKGDIKNTYGTGCFCLMNTGEEIIYDDKGLLTTIAISLDGKINYALEGSVFIAGAVVQWLRDELKIINNAKETNKICKSIKNTNGVYFIPAFAGLGTPYWNPKIRGTIFGLTGGVHDKHIIRAAIESIAYQSNDLIDAMKSVHGDFNFLSADGGVSNNDFLMQFQSDILDSEIIVPDLKETTALGAAFLAGLATGFWNSLSEIKKLSLDHKRYSPKMNPNERKRLIEGWDGYISQLLK